MAVGQFYILKISKRATILLMIFLTAVFPLFTILNTATASAAPAFNYYPIPFGYGPNYPITTGPDGALWFAQAIPAYTGVPDEIVRMTTSNSFTQFPIPAYANFSLSGAYIKDIIPGPDGAIWFTDPTTDQIEKFTISGQFTAYTIPSSYNNNSTYNDVGDLTTGSDGALWFVMPRSSKIGRITPSGSITEYSLASGVAPSDIVSGADGALWFTEVSGNKIGRITTAGSITEYALPSPNANPHDIRAGSDGTLWFNEAGIKSIGRITTSGTITEYPLPSDTFGLGNGIAVGPDGGLWFFTQTYDNNLYSGNLVHLATSGILSKYTFLGPQSQPTSSPGITMGPDNALWLTDSHDNQIVRADLSLLLTPSAPTNLTATSPVQNPTLSWSAADNATSYNVYRNGTEVGSTADTNYTDTTAPEGTNSYYVTAANSAGESTPSNTVSVLTDRTAPVITIPPSWTANPLQQSQNTTLSVAVSDTLSGVAGVQYTLNGGAPQPMTYDTASGTWQATFGSNLAVNTYNVNITATDSAGNTSSAYDILAVYNAVNGYVTGHAKFLPTSTDTLPIALDTSNNPTQLVLGFTNVMAPASGSFDLDYKVKNNQNEFSLSSTGINWVVVPDSTHASILGSATMTSYVNGVATVAQNVPVEFDITLGANGTPGHVTVKIYSAGANPSTDTPQYVIDDDVQSNGSNVMIHP